MARFPFSRLSACPACSALCFLGALVVLSSVPGFSQQAIQMTPFPKQVEQTTEGDWGTLEFYKIRLACPEEYLSFLSIPSEQPEWVFPFDTEEEVVEYLRNSGLTPEEVELVKVNWKVILSEESIRVFPAEETVLTMPAFLRSKLSAALSRFPQNHYHRRPAFLNTANVSRYFHDSNLSIETLQNIARLAYPTPSGHGFFLSDVPYLMRGARSSGEERLLMDALLRVPALMVRLDLSKTDSLDSLTKYWSAGFRNKQVLPLFESVMDNPHVTKLDIAHLLPPLARKNLNNFPAQADGINGRFPDWFWTCYNFFRFSTRHVYAETEESRTLLESEFTPADSPYRFGDLLLLKSGDRTIHGCIYIADDIVYTKNGADLFSPTILMKLPDVISFHDLKGNVTLAHYRKITRERDLSPLPSAGRQSN